MKSAVFILLLAAIRDRLGQKAKYVWPLSNSAASDETNTSFGPRINRNKWDFHDGIDLPASIGTNVHAVRAGTVRHAGDGGSGGFSSRHVVIESNDPHDGLSYHLYLHLNSIDGAAHTGASVSQGQVIGTVGDDGATYPHLHFELRKGTHREIGSIHPLGCLPYPDTANFSAPVADRFNRFGASMAARLLFGASSKLEGDMKRVEVDLRNGATLLLTRAVDFNDKTTVNEGNGDELIFVNDIGVEGYQKSDMVAHGRTDLKYGILVRNIPGDCDTLVARVIDLGAHIATSAGIAVPDQAMTDKYVDFEDAGTLPQGWSVVTSTTGTGTSVSFDAAAARTGSHGMRSVDDSTTERKTQRAGIEFDLPEGRFEWTAEGWFNPTELDLAEGQSVYLLHFLSDGDLSVAARIHNREGSLRAGIVAKQPDESLEGADGPAVIETDEWRKWRLHILRIGTRETTAVLYLNEGEQLVEQVRVNWDSTKFEPRTLRAGIGLSSAGAMATVLTDELRVTESELS